MASRIIYEIRMAAGIYNGGYRTFTGYPKSFKTWTIDHQSNLEFLGDGAVRRGLSGFERANPAGQREGITISFDNADPTTALELRAILQLGSSLFEREFFLTTAGTITSLTVVLSGAVQTDDYYNGLIIYNQDAGEIRVVQDYLGATRAATVDASLSSWSIGDNLYLLARPNIPTVFGISTDDNDANMTWYNMVSYKYGIRREQGIAKQVINVEFREVERKKTIRDQIRIQ